MLFLQIMSVVKFSADMQTHALIFLYKQTVYKHNYVKISKKISITWAELLPYVSIIGCKKLGMK